MAMGMEGEGGVALEHNPRLNVACGCSLVVVEKVTLDYIIDTIFECLSFLRGTIS